VSQDYEEARKRFFFEKKKQKTFAKLGLGPRHQHGPGPKVFWFPGRGAFFSKKNFFLP
jgi:hypothetical protein